VWVSSPLEWSGGGKAGDKNCFSKTIRVVTIQF
jgi:hypothetical protein